MHPDSTWPLDALEGERQDQPRSGKMDEPESRFWERESGAGGGGRSNSRGMKEMHGEGEKLAELNAVVSERGREPITNPGTV